jgi:GNAT superfamily N-acetyltransferase
MAEVEGLKSSDKLELLDLFTTAFVEYPLHPAFGPKEVGRMMRALLDFFGGMRSAWLYGIREGGKIVCASLSVDSRERERFLPLLRFILATIRAVGWRMAKKLSEVVHEQAPKYEERYLELVLLATLPALQKRGLGRGMLRFLCERAREEGYKGVILMTNRDYPAFRFYLKEGFVVDREVELEGVRLCHMRLAF